MKSIKEKMKELAEVSNISFKEFIEYSNENRLDVIKNNSDFQAIQKQGAKVFGTVKAIKLTSTDSEGNTEDEKWVLRSVFTSNKADCVFAGALFAFTISFDNITATVFWRPSGMETVPTQIFGMLRNSVSPEINALGFVMICITVGVPLIAGALARYYSRKKI